MGPMQELKLAGGSRERALSSFSAQGEGLKGLSGLQKGNYDWDVIRD